jgi:hypothetical protein
MKTKVSKVSKLSLHIEILSSDGDESISKIIRLLSPPPQSQDESLGLLVPLVHPAPASTLRVKLGKI